MSEGNIHVQSLFIWCMAAIYFFAFSSLYFQIPGLYGRKGLMPAVKELKGQCFDSDERCTNWAEFGECKNNQNWMERNCMVSCKVCEIAGELSITQKLSKKKTLLWFSPALGLDVSSGMELICLYGMTLSIAAMISSGFQNKFVFIALWLLYFSVYQVGQTFLWFQWDILLLETGFLTIFVAQFFNSKSGMNGGHTAMAFWLVKWLLFRLMFQSGVVKLQSDCPTWWGLTALNWHYESQCIPAPLAWYAHQLPEWFQKLSVVATYVIEIALPFLFFLPIRSLRIWGFFSQILLQVLIIMTGNYTFFNLLTMTLCLSLIDDRFLFEYTPSFVGKYFQLPKVTYEKRSIFRRLSMFLLKTAVTTTLIYWTVKYFDIRFAADSSQILSDIAFSKEEFKSAVTKLTRFSIYMGILSHLVHLVRYLGDAAADDRKLKTLIRTFFAAIFATVAGWIFCISLVPFTQIDRSVQNDIWPVVKEWNNVVDSYELVHSYGLFRSMTGVGGRPEIIIEGTNDFRNGPWKEYNFKYKPGNLKTPLPVVAPHQPRLDWQMWFAALGSYQHNPWFIHLIYKLLEGEKDVLDLVGENPFPDKPPIYIRSRLYTYHYTTLSKQTTGIIDGVLRSRRIGSWWNRDSPKEYTPPLSVNDESLINYIKSLGWHKQKLKKEKPNGKLYLFLKAVRKLLKNLDPTFFMFQIILFSLIFKYFYHL